MEKNIDDSDTNPYRYAGEYFDSETGTYYLRARYYEPATGRFTSEDPSGDGLNLYIYCYNNPLIFIDPSGLIPTDLEAAYMAEHIYSATTKDIDSSKAVTGNWYLIKIITGGDGMVMGIYSKIGDFGRIEYALVNKGTTPGNLSDWKNNAQQLSGNSMDTQASIAEAKKFVEQYGDNEITMVGHSKGAAEAAANAIATNRNVILFNPAPIDFSAYKDLRVLDYSANMYLFYVKGDILNNLFGYDSYTALGDRLKVQNPLPSQSRFSWIWYGPIASNIANSINNHSLSSVKKGLNGVR